MECVESKQRTCLNCSVVLICGENITKNRYDLGKNQCKSCRDKHNKEYLNNINATCSTEEVSRWKRVRKIASLRICVWKKENPNIYCDNFKTIMQHLFEKYPVLPTKCPILNIDLKYSSSSPGDPLWQNSISLDRIDSNLGYVIGNVQIISFRANTIKNNASVEEIFNLFKYCNDIDKKETKTVLKKYGSVFFQKNNGEKTQKKTKILKKQGGIASGLVDDGQFEFDFVTWS